jgi:hypothetical protein
VVAVSLAVMIVIIALELVAWTWYTLSGVITTLIVGSLLTFAKSSRVK